MQAASSPYLPPPPQPYYQNIYHIQPLAPQDHELKRQYLALLPPQQVIEICLTFDVHVPPYIKSTIWPPDINAAIANLRSKPTVNGDASASAPQKDNDKPPEPVMGSLEKPPEEPDKTTEPGTSSTEVQGTTESQPQVSKPAENGAAPTSTATATTQTPVPPTPVPQPTTPAAPPAQQQPPYPHQPYGYPQHPPAAYPHAPYYPPPPGYPSYPHTPYPHYPPPVPNGYPHPHPPHPTYPPPPPAPNPLYPTPHIPQPQPHPDGGSDDLPSYEEMIVEALQESTDPEGCAPKDLFAWMAARYPLQSNFRPSASQALQKAFKRGRFEKSSNGKYRLSASWEGGNTSRRTTRRPQTQSQSQTSAMSNASGSPFTHAPLVHHHHQQQQQQNHAQAYAGPPYPFPYGGVAPPAPGYPGFPHPQPQPQPPAQPQPSISGASKTTGDKTIATEPSSDVDKDTYEAAQNILKAINFGDLFQIAADGTTDGSKKPDEHVSVDQLTSLLVQAQHALSQQQEDAGSGPGPLGVLSPPVAPGPLPTLSAAAGVAVAGGSVPEPPTNVRAELQAQLALLAAQLAELSQENAEAATAAVQQNGRLQTTGRPSFESQPQEQQHSEVQPPPLTSSSLFTQPFMNALLPPPDFSLPEPQAQMQQQPASTTSSLPVQPATRTVQPPSQQEDIPIDPVLQGLGGIAGPPSVSSTDPIQPPAVNPAATIGPIPTAPGLAPTGEVPSATPAHSPPQAPPPLHPPPIFATPESLGVSTAAPSQMQFQAPAAEAQPQTQTQSTPSVEPTLPPPEPVSAPVPLKPSLQEPQATTPNFVDGETDSDDDDMEEIA